MRYLLLHSLELARARALLLSQLLHQDVARSPAGVRLKKSVSRDRIVSMHDPEMRH